MPGVGTIDIDPAGQLHRFAHRLTIDQELHGADGKAPGRIKHVDHGAQVRCVTFADLGLRQAQLGAGLPGCHLVLVHLGGGLGVPGITEVADQNVPVAHRHVADLQGGHPLLQFHRIA